MKAGKAKTAAAVKPKKTAGKRKAQGAAFDESATLPEMFTAVVSLLGVIADRLESIRRTLWRMESVRQYHGKGANGDAENETGGDNGAE